MNEPKKKTKKKRRGFSYVFAAEEIGTGRKFAIKRMTCQDEATVKEAVREAELYRLFSHPNIIAIEDSCVLPSGSQETGSVAKDVYMVLPLHRRGSVLDIITAKQAAQNGHPFVLSEAEVVRITRGLCAAVAQLHHFKPPGPSSVETPLAHRDIKPGNILMAHDGTPILMVCLISRTDGFLQRGQPKKKKKKGLWECCKGTKPGQDTRASGCIDRKGKCLF